MAKYIECPKMWGSPSLFMGGGISGCPDWQAQLVRELKDVDLVLVNPRRKVFDVQNAANTRLQIRREYLMLRRCDGILFWFPCESICPTVLFELGTYVHLVASTQGVTKTGRLGRSIRTTPPSRHGPDTLHHGLVDVSVRSRPLRFLVPDSATG